MFIGVGCPGKPDCRQGIYIRPGASGCGTVRPAAFDHDSSAPLHLESAGGHTHSSTSSTPGPSGGDHAVDMFHTEPLPEGA